MDWLAFSCVHLPIHHIESVEWLIDEVRDRKPDLIVSLGDLIDCQVISKHEQWRPPSLEEEYDAARVFLGRLADVSKQSHLVCLDGNHEERIYREENKRLGSLIDWKRHCRKELKRFRRFVHRPYVNSPRGQYSLGQITFAHGHSSSESRIRQTAYKSAPPFGLFISGHTHRPHGPRQVVAASMPLRSWVANPGTFITPEIKDGYARGFDTSGWGCGYLAGTVDPKRRHAPGPLWTCDLVKSPSYPEVI